MEKWFDLAELTLPDQFFKSIEAFEVILTIFAVRSGVFIRSWRVDGRQDHPHCWSQPATWRCAKPGCRGGRAWKTRNGKTYGDPSKS